MTYPFIAIGLIAIFIIYVLYLFVTKNKTKARAVLPVGLFFIAIWAIIYYFFIAKK